MVPLLFLLIVSSSLGEKCAYFSEYEGCVTLELDYRKDMDKLFIKGEDIAFAQKGFFDSKPKVQVPSDEEWIKGENYDFILDGSQNMSCLNTKYVELIHKENDVDIGNIMAQYPYPAYWGSHRYLTWMVNMWIKIGPVTILQPFLIGCPGVIEEYAISRSIAGIIGLDFVQNSDALSILRRRLMEIPYPPLTLNHLHHTLDPSKKKKYWRPFEFPLIDIYRWYYYEYIDKAIEFDDDFWAKSIYMNSFMEMVDGDDLLSIMKILTRSDNIFIDREWKILPQRFDYNEKTKLKDIVEYQLFERVLSLIRTPESDNNSTDKRRKTEIKTTYTYSIPNGKIEIGSGRGYGRFGAYGGAYRARKNYYGQNPMSDDQWKEYIRIKKHKKE